MNPDIIDLFNDYRRVAGGMPDAAATLVLAHILANFDTVIDEAVIADMNVSVNGEEVVPEVASPSEPAPR